VIQTVGDYIALSCLVAQASVAQASVAQASSLWRAQAGLSAVA